MKKRRNEKWKSEWVEWISNGNIKFVRRFLPSKWNDKIEMQEKKGMKWNRWATICMPAKPVASLANDEWTNKDANKRRKSVFFLSSSLRLLNELALLKCLEKYSFRPWDARLSCASWVLFVHHHFWWKLSTETTNITKNSRHAATQSLLLVNDIKHLPRIITDFSCKIQWIFSRLCFLFEFIFIRFQRIDNNFWCKRLPRLNACDTRSSRHFRINF